MTTDPVPELKELLGEPVVFLAWPKGSKYEMRKWGHLNTSHMTPEYLVGLKDGNIGVALGEKSGGLISIDLDADNLVQPFFDLNPHLKGTLQTHGARGRMIWLRMKGNYPKKTSFLKSHSGGPLGEWRAGGGTQSIVWGIHPDTKRPYEFVVRQPAVTVSFESIRWPDEILIHPTLQSRTDVIKGVVACSSKATLSCSVKLEPNQSSALSCSVNLEPKQPALSCSVKSLEHAVELSLPTSKRRNNSTLFHLARALLTLEQHIPIGLNEKTWAFSEWHKRTQALGFLRPGQTKDHYWLEFMKARKNATIPLGVSPLDRAWRATLAEPMPPEAGNFDSTEMKQLLALCFQLEKASNGEPWYVSCRDAAKLVRKSHATCAAMLSGFVDVGLLTITEPGTRFKSPRYRWTGEFAEVHQEIAHDEPQDVLSRNTETNPAPTEFVLEI